LSTEELFSQAFAQLRSLKNRVMGRRQRDKAMELVTELFLSVEGISRRVSQVSFVERPVVLDDEDDADGDTQVPMAELFSHADDHPVDELDTDDVHELREMVRALRKTRQEYFRLFLAYQVKGCRHERDVSKKVLAITRRVMPSLLTQFGLSQSAVGRKFGEGRANVSAREKRVVEATLKAAGARGVLSNGARGAETSAKCAKAARGNKNRAGGRRSEHAEFRVPGQRPRTQRSKP